MFHDTASALFGVPGPRVTDADPGLSGAVEVWAVTDCEGAAACPDCGTLSSRVHDMVVTCPKDVRRAGDPVDLNWVRLRLKCVSPDCGRRTFTERVPAVPPGCRVLPRLKEQCADEVADRGITPAEAARHAGVSRLARSCAWLTAASSPWTAGSASPAPALTCCGASRTAPAPSRSGHLRTLADGSELVVLRESAGMLGRRRKDAGDRALARLPDTAARLVCFTIVTRTRRGRSKSAQVRVLTTLLYPVAFPAAAIAECYSRRWGVETAFLHLKKTVHGAGRELRGQSPELVRQEAWALFLVHNMIAAMAAADAGTSIATVSFTAVLALVRAHVAADACCPHCGKRPSDTEAPLAPLAVAIAA